MQKFKKRQLLLAVLLFTYNLQINFNDVLVQEVEGDFHKQVFVNLSVNMVYL